MRIALDYHKTQVEKLRNYPLMCKVNLPYYHRLVSYNK